MRHASILRLVVYIMSTMDHHEVITLVWNAIDKYEATTKRKTLPLVKLREYLTDLKTAFGQSSDSARAMQFRDDAALAEYRGQIDGHLELIRGTNQAGQAALRTVIIINGGAAAAQLAFLGTLISNGAIVWIHGIAWSLLLFVLGTLLGAVATGTTYLAAFLADSERQWRFHTFNGLAIGLVVVAYVMFACGAYSAYQTAVRIAP